jgi:hypothetical protein
MEEKGTRFLHVANGTSTTRTIEAAGIPGQLSIWADPLDEGPLPPGLDDTELLEVRRRYLAGTLAAASDDPTVDPVNDLRRWRAAIEGHESYDEMVLWYEHDLFDQLNLIQLLAWTRKRIPATKPVSLVSIGSFPGRPNFKGLGELTPGELAPLMATRQPVGVPQYTVAERAWDAFRQPTPESLDDIRRQDTSALPYLAPALTRFLQEYPWTSDGLSRTERHLLELAGRAGIELSNAFPRMHDGETAYYIADGSLKATADRLCGTSPPLLTLHDGGTGTSAGLRGSVTLTDAGAAVLSGAADRIALCGIDRWLGGVHLQTGSRIWRWDDARHRIV